MKQNSFFKSKIFRYGAASVVLTALIVALIIVLNVVFTLLASHYNWYKDMTEEQLYTVSDASASLLDEIFKPDKETGKPVFEGKMSIIFLREEDKIKSATSDEGKRLEQIRKLAQAYESKYSDKIEVKYIDLNAQPGEVAKYTSKGTGLTTETVVFDSNAGPYTAVRYEYFFYYGNENSSVPTAFYGEHRITMSILSVCSKQVVAYSTTGHGEDALPSAFRMLLESSGYTIKDVDLQNTSYEQLKAQVRADKPRLVIVNNPKTEFVTVTETGSERNEIQKLRAILGGECYEGTASDFTSLLVITDPAKKCQNGKLNSVLEEWGLEIKSTDADLITEDVQNAINTEGTAFLATYSSDELFSKLTTKLRSSSSYRVALEGAGSVGVVSLGDSDLGVRNGSVIEASDGRSVLAVSQLEHNVEQTITKYSYAIVIPDADLVSDKYLTSASFANEALVNNLLRMTTIDSEATPRIVEIDSFKDYVTESNVTAVTVGQKQAFLIFMAAVLPVAILTVGVVVYVRRRNRV